MCIRDRCNIPSGEYEAGFKAKLTAVSQNSNATLEYTTDGTDPTAKSKQVATGNTINIDETCTLKFGLLSNGTVTEMCIRDRVSDRFFAKWLVGGGIIAN